MVVLPGAFVGAVFAGAPPLEAGHGRPTRWGTLALDPPGPRGGPGAEEDVAA